MIAGRSFSIRNASLALAAGLVVSTMGTAAIAGPRKVELDTASGPHVFNVSVMRTEAEREKGLMFVRSMPKDEGMLFDFHEPQQIMMWMKNTLIPLDMVFIAADGHVVSIAHDAKPEDETIIPSREPALGVLELNGGAADVIGLKVGDLVKHPMFHTAP